jgi:hypothetical protein
LTVSYLRDPQTPGNQVEDPKEPTLADRFRAASSRLARFWALCSSSVKLNEFRDDLTGIFREQFADHEAIEKLVVKLRPVGQHEDRRVAQARVPHRLGGIHLHLQRCADHAEVSLYPA